MITKLRLIIVTLLAAIGLLGLTPAMVLAADCNNDGTAKGALQCGVTGANGGQPTNSQNATNSFNDIVRSVFNILSVIAGIIAVVMIILAGFKFITSSGNQEKVHSARNALVYAAIGLVVVALSQILVQFVLNKATTATTTSSSAAPQAAAPVKQLTLSTSEYIV